MFSEFLEKNSQKVTYHTKYLKDLKITDNGIVYQDRSLKRFNQWKQSAQKLFDEIIFW